MNTTKTRPQNQPALPGGALRALLGRMAGRAAHQALETCPTLEDLACFLDGKLAGKERSKIVSHLADCESCYAVFADAARLQLEEAEENAAPAEAQVVPIHRRRFPAWPTPWEVPLAAMLFLGTAAIGLYFWYFRMPEMTTAELVNRSNLAALRTLATDRWPRNMRGDQEAAGIDTRPREFLVGAHLVDLRWALATNHRAESLQALSRINGNVESLSFIDDQRAFYLRAQRQLYDRQAQPRDFLDEAAATEASLTEFLDSPESPYLSFGKWTESGRLFALAKQPSFFEDRENRRFPGWLVRHAEDVGLDREAVTLLEEIRELVDKSEASAYLYDALAGEFEDILNHYQNEADAQAEGLAPSP